jgi:hypothetical protein
MKVKLKIIFALSMMLLMSVSACGSNSTTIDEQISVLAEKSYLNADLCKVNLDFKSILYYVRLIDGNIVFVKNKNGQIEYINRLFNGEQISCGSNDRFLMSMKQSAMDYPYLYFYIGEIMENSGANTNTLTRLNLVSHTIDRIEHQDNSILGVSTYLFKGDIVTIKNEIIEEKIKTYIDCYNINNNIWEKHLECFYNTASEKGEALYGICANDSNLFVLHDICNNREDVKHYLEVLDKGYNVIQSIEIDKDIHDYVLSNFISDMQTFDNYVYIYNASNKGYLAYVEDNTLKEVYKNTNFEMAINSDSNQPVFFIRRSNSVLQFDKKKEKLEEYNLQVKTGYNIKTILCDQKYFFIVFYADDMPDYAYLIPREDITNVIFSCE